MEICDSILRIFIKTKKSNHIKRWQVFVFFYIYVRDYLSLYVYSTVDKSRLHECRADACADFIFFNHLLPKLRKSNFKAKMTHQPYSIPMYTYNIRYMWCFNLLYIISGEPVVSLPPVVTSPPALVGFVHVSYYCVFAERELVVLGRPVIV